MTEETKPPVGLRPESAFNTEHAALRVKEIREAIGRYLATGLEIPPAWLNELSRRTGPDANFKSALVAPDKQNPPYCPRCHPLRYFNGPTLIGQAQ